MTAPEKLEEMRQRIEEGERPVVSFGSLLAWFGMSAPNVRGLWEVNRALQESGLVTVPSVRECKSLNTPVTFHPDASSSVRPSTAVREPPGPTYAAALAGAPKMVTSGHQASRGP